MVSDSEACASHWRTPKSTCSDASSEAMVGVKLKPPPVSAKEHERTSACAKSSSSRNRCGRSLQPKHAPEYPANQLTRPAEAPCAAKPASQTEIASLRHGSAISSRARSLS